MKKKMAAQRQAMKGLPHGNATAIAQILALAFSAIQKCWKNRIYSKNLKIELLCKSSFFRWSIII